RIWIQFGVGADRNQGDQILSQPIAQVDHTADVWTLGEPCAFAYSRAEREVPAEAAAAETAGHPNGISNAGAGAGDDSAGVAEQTQSGGKPGTGCDVAPDNRYTVGSGRA